MKKKLPNFRSEKEMADFWSKNSPLDYPDEFEEIKTPLQFSLRFLKKLAEKHKEKKKTYTLRVEESQILLAKLIANRKGNYYQALIRHWIREGIIRELDKNPDIENYIRKQKLHLI